MLPEIRLAALTHHERFCGKLAPRQDNRPSEEGAEATTRYRAELKRDV